MQDGNDSILIDIPDENFTDDHGEHIVFVYAECMRIADCSAATLCGRACMIRQPAMQPLHMLPHHSNEGTEVLLSELTVMFIGSNLMSTCLMWQWPRWSRQYPCRASGGLC